MEATQTRQPVFTMAIALLVHIQMKLHAAHLVALAVAAVIQTKEVVHLSVLAATVPQISVSLSAPAMELAMTAADAQAQALTLIRQIVKQMVAHGHLIISVGRQMCGRAEPVTVGRQARGHQVILGRLTHGHPTFGLRKNIWINETHSLGMSE